MIREQQKRAKQLQKKTKHQQTKYIKAREEWFKKFNEDPQACFTINVDGEEIEISNIAKPGQRPIYKIDRDGRTTYTESLKNIDKLTV